MKKPEFVDWRDCVAAENTHQQTKSNLPASQSQGQSSSTIRDRPHVQRKLKSKQPQLAVYKTIKIGLSEIDHPSAPTEKGKQSSVKNLVDKKFQDRSAVIDAFAESQLREWNDAADSLARQKQQMRSAGSAGALAW